MPLTNKLGKLRVLFMGTPEYALPTLLALINNPDIEVVAVATQPDKVGGRGDKILVPPIKNIATKHNIKVLQPVSIKKLGDDFIKELAQLGEIDLGVVIAFGQILPKSVLNFPKLGCVNLHASILPRWRGAAPIQRALMAGDTQTGVCLMKMDEGLDTGDILAQIESDIKLEDNFQSLHDKLAQMSADLLISNINIIPTLSPRAQDSSGITYANKISNDECLINWSDGAISIHNRIRALSPFPGAYTLLAGKRLKIYTARPYLIELRKGLDFGEISLIDKNRCDITCSDGVVSISDVQLEGKKRMKIDDFIRGSNITVGLKFS